MQASCIILLLFVNLIFRKDMNNINLKMTIIPSVAKVKQVVLFFISIVCVILQQICCRLGGDASGQEEKEIFSPTLDIPPDIHLYEPEYYPLFKKEVIGESAVNTQDLP